MKGALAQLFFVLAGVAAVAALWRAARLLGLAARPVAPAQGDGLQPLPVAADNSPRDAELVRLQDERRRLLAHLREIQFDFETGKIDARDHQELAAKYEQEALAVLRALDAYSTAQTTPSTARAETNTARAETNTAQAEANTAQAEANTAQAEANTAQHGAQHG